MSEIAENVSLEMSNVISYRGKVTQLQLQEISRDMERIITSNNAKKNGSGERNCSSISDKLKWADIWLRECRQTVYLYKI